MSSSCAGSTGSYPGDRLGRPEFGSGSVARPGRRVLGLAVDWAMALLIGRTFMPELVTFGPLVVLLVEQVLLVGTAGYGLGHRVAGLRVETADGHWPGPLRALVRAVLLVLAVPALIWDADQRGLHDRIAGTVIVRR